MIERLSNYTSNMNFSPYHYGFIRLLLSSTNDKYLLKFYAKGCHSNFVGNMNCFWSGVPDKSLQN